MGVESLANNLKYVFDLPGRDYAQKWAGDLLRFCDGRVVIGNRVVEGGVIDQVWVNLFAGSERQLFLTFPRSNSPDGWEFVVEHAGEEKFRGVLTSLKCTEDGCLLLRSWDADKNEVEFLHIRKEQEGLSFWKFDQSGNQIS